MKRILPAKSGKEKYLLLMQLSSEYLITEPVASFNYSSEALKIATLLNDDEKIAEAHQSIGSSKGRIGDYALSLKHFNLAIEYFKKTGNTEMVVYTSNDIAGVNANLKRYDVALNIYNELLSYYYNNNIMSKYCSILNNIGTILFEKGEFDIALENYSKALEMINKIRPNDRGFLAVLYCNIGEAYFGKKDFGLSLKYRKWSLGLYKELKNEDGIANLQMDTGSSLIELKDYGRAKQSLDSALIIYTRIKYAEGIRKTRQLFIRLYQKINQFDKALEECAELEKLSIAGKDSFMIANCYGNYSDIYFARGNFKLSADYFKKFIELNDKIDTKVNKLRMLELQTVFETEEKEFENKTLRHENDLQKEKLKAKENLLIVVSVGILVASLLLFILYREEKKIRKINARIKMQNLKLEELIISKDKFFSILAHNLKNPFWAVLGQNKMLEDEYDELTAAERKELISGIGVSASNVFKLFEDLLKWAKTQLNTVEIEKEKINLKELMLSSIEPYLILAKNKKVDIVIQVNDSIELYADKFMLETVFGNLIDNAIKFSMQREKVIVLGHLEDNNVVVVIEDSGLGIPSNKLDKLFKIDVNVSTSGTMNEKGTGLGLIICKEFIDKHSGTITVNSKVGKGTSFKVILPQK